MLEEQVQKSEQIGAIRQALQPIYSMIEDPVKVKNMMNDNWFTQLLEKFPVLNDRVNTLDPYYEIEREDIRKFMENDFETYQEEA